MPAKRQTITSYYMSDMSNIYLGPTFSQTKSLTNLKYVTWYCLGICM